MVEKSHHSCSGRVHLKFRGGGKSEKVCKIEWAYFFFLWSKSEVKFGLPANLSTNESKALHTLARNHSISGLKSRVLKLTFIE